MSHSTKVLALWPACAVSVAALAQEPAGVLRRLDVAKARAGRVSCGATVYVTQAHGDQRLTTRYTWACSGRSLSLRSLPVSAKQDRSQSVWNGRSGYVRTWAAGVSPGSPPSSTMLTPASPVWINPVRFAYGVNIQGPQATHGWLADVLREVTFKASLHADGRLVLDVPSVYRYRRRRLELNPNWDYMTDLDQEYGPGRGFFGQGRSTLYLMNERRVLEAKKVGGCWIPTKYRTLTFFGIRPSTNSALETTIELRNIQGVVDHGAFRSLSAAERKTALRAPTGLPSPRVLRRTSRPEAPGGIEGRPNLPTAAILAVGVGAVVVGGLSIFWRRRRPDGYWGPTGPQ